MENTPPPHLSENIATDESEELELNSLQAACIKKLFATYQANLVFFEQQFPYVFEKLIQFDAEVPFSIDEEGKLTIHYKNNVGSPKDFIDLGKALFQFFDNPELRARITTDVSYIHNEKILAPQADMPYFYYPVEPEYRIRLLRRFKELCPESDDFTIASSFGEKKSLITVIFGVGYGWDIEKIVDDYEIRHIIIIEPDVRNLNLSLFFLDYVSLYHRFQARGGKEITFLTYDDEKTQEGTTEPDNLDTSSDKNSKTEKQKDEADPTIEAKKQTERNRSLAKDLQFAIKAFWPPYMARGINIHFNDYRSDDVKEIWSSLANDLISMYMGWGFFDDEILSLLHATQNLHYDYPVCSRFAKNIPPDAVAFVVGSGPSLDELLPLIEKYKDQAIIISCGTALTVLARKNIKPDIHIEIERTHFTYEFMAHPKHAEIVKDLPLLLIPAIPPGVFKLTSRPLMLLKAIDAGSQLVDIENKKPKFSTGPTVTNCGTDFCLRMGIPNIYLLGVDVGYPNDGPHHSTLTYYYDKEHSSENLAESVKLIDKSCKGGIPVPGNFGDEVLSNAIYMQTRDLIAYSIEQFKQRSAVFNLNRGAKIPGATALHSKDCQIESTSTSKQQALDEIFNCFTHDYEKEADRNIRYLAEQMEAVIMDAHQILKRDYQNTLEVCDALADFWSYLNAKKHAKTAIFPMLRGSMLHMCRIFYECLTMIKSPETALIYAQDGIDTLLEFLIAGQELILRIPEEARRRENTALLTGDKQKRTWHE